MKRVILALGAAATTVGGTAVQADQTGLAGMHAQRVVKGRLCFTDHAHVGTGTRQPSKRAAISAAAQDWSSFTAFEYGSSWAHWGVAIAKATKCEPAGGKWTCEVQARPCLNRRTRRTRHVNR